MSEYQAIINLSVNCIIFANSKTRHIIPMKIVVSHTIYDPNGVCRSIFDIRSRVFVDEQMVDRSEEFDAYETGSLHYLGLADGTPAGTARWRFTEKGIKLERFAVLKEFRNRGVAAAVLQQVLSDVIPFKKRIYLNAQVTAIGFYERYGFKKEGPMFVEANIDHFVMTYNPE